MQVTGSTSTAEGSRDAASAAHVCALPVSDEQLWEMTARFLADGLALGERVVYFDDDGAAASVLRRLAEDRVEVEGPMARGQLAVMPPEVTRAALRSSVAEVRGLVEATADASVADGWAGLRLTGQFHYGLERAGGVALWEYDLALDAALRSRPNARTVCFYDRTHYPEGAIAEMRGLHHTELHAPAVYDDGLLRITRLGPCRAQIAGEVDFSNRPRLSKVVEAALDESVRDPDAPHRVELDLSSLRFLDVAGAVALVHLAEAFPSTHRLVLRGVSPRVLRILDRCGAPFAAQLTVHPHGGTG